jgi:hypothetical protein
MEVQIAFEIYIYHEAANIFDDYHCSLVQQYTPVAFHTVGLYQGIRVYAWMKSEILHDCMTHKPDNHNV